MLSINILLKNKIDNVLLIAFITISDNLTIVVSHYVSLKRLETCIKLICWINKRIEVLNYSITMTENNWELRGMLQLK